MPNLYILAGCNGAGKTTASKTVLPEIWNCCEFVNADNIAAALCPAAPESVAFEAGRMMLERINFLIDQRADLSIETTLSTRSYVYLIKEARQKGYKITMLFFWLNSPEMAIERVVTRVEKGGHNIPADVVRRRYGRRIQNLVNLYREICDSWMVVNNMFENPEVIAEGRFLERESILNEELWNFILDQKKVYDTVKEPEVHYHTNMSERIIESIRKAVYHLIIEAANKDQSLVVADKKGSFGRVPAKELLKRIK